MDHDFIQASQIRYLKKREPDFRDEFWQQLPDMRSTAPREYPATLNKCVFDRGNKKVYHQRGCEHNYEKPSDDEA